MEAVAVEADPDALEDQADDLEIEARRLRQRARHLRKAGVSSSDWLDGETVERIYGIKMPTVTAAARRGELAIGYAGRSPRVSKAAIDAWIATRKHPLSKPADGPSFASMYASLAAPKVARHEKSR